MYVERDERGHIVGAWEDPRREGQELLPIDNAELQAWLAQPTGHLDKTGWDASKWA